MRLKSKFLSVIGILAFCLFHLAGATTARAGTLRVVLTAHYRIETDLDPEFVADTGHRMDAMYDEYARRFSKVVELRPAQIFHVYLFHSKGQYLNMVGVHLQNTAGVCVHGAPGGDFLAAYVGSQGRDQFRKTLQHEAFHQFVVASLPHDLPAWLNEGMAEVYSEGLWNGEGFWLGQVPPRRIRQLQTDLQRGRLTDFRTLASLSAQEWARVFTGEHSRGATQYNHAWAMVYFLMHYKDAAGQEAYKARVVAMFKLLQKGTDAIAAFNEVFPDAPAIQEQFVAYARAMQPTRDAALADKQIVLGDLLVELKARHPMPTDITGIRAIMRRESWRMHYSNGDFQWESDPNVALYFSDFDGRPFTRRELTLEPRPGAKIPDVVCRCFDKYQFRTRFFEAGEKLEHEILLEPSPVIVEPLRK